MKKKTALFSSLFLAPAFIMYTIFIVFPVLSSVYYSLTEWNGVSEKVFIWFDNYKELFRNQDYWKVVKNTGILVAYSLIFQVPLGLILAYLLSRNVRGFKFFRLVYFFPVVISPIAIGLMFTLFYNSELGPLNKLLETIGLGFLKKQWLSDPKVVLRSVIVPQVWQYIGLYVIIFLAGLFSIPQEIFESAHIDGASSTRVFTGIVIPMMKDIIKICIILSVVGSIKSFDHPWVLTNGGPGIASSYIAVLMFRTAFLNSMIGYGSAITITILIYALLFTGLFNKYFPDEVE